MKKLSSLLLLFLAGKTYAHCPLCVVGAAAVAGTAKLFGVHTAVVALFVGAFAMSIGIVIEKRIKKTYIPFQKHVIWAFAFITTIIPLMPFLGGDYVPFSIFLFGKYGSLFNTTYVLDYFILGSLLGGAMVMITPHISKKITELRGSHLPFQGIAVTMLVLLIFGSIIQLYLK